MVEGRADKGIEVTVLEARRQASVVLGGCRSRFLLFQLCEEVQGKIEVGVILIGTILPLGKGNRDPWFLGYIDTAYLMN